MSTSDTPSTGRGGPRTHGAATFLKGVRVCCCCLRNNWAEAQGPYPPTIAPSQALLFLGPLKRKDVSGAFAGTAEPPPPPRPGSSSVDRLLDLPGLLPLLVLET